jgi:hypothetical protein
MTSIIVVLTFLLMVIMNVLANALPINNITTGAVSDSYANLFAPAGITFSIWLIIYLLLLGYTLYQLGEFKRVSYVTEQLHKSIGFYFALSSVANALWILAWHYGQIAISVLLMFIILGCLIQINLITRSEDFSPKSKFLVKVPFEVYFGWITVATIANITVLLVELEWQMAGLSEVFWTCSVIILGSLIAGFNINFYNSPVYGTVILWAYAGIILKHMSPSGFGGQYIEVIIAAGAGMLIILMAEAVYFRRKIRTSE